MTGKKIKIAIIGAGAVGTSVAFDLSIQGLCDEIVLIDIRKEKAYAEALDIQQSVAYQHRHMKITSGTYEDCGDADIVVMTAAVPYVQGQRRLDMLEGAAKVIRSIVPAIMESGFNGHFIIVTNPVDVISYLVHKLSKLPKNQVIGTGTSLDSARLKGMIADLLQVDSKSVQAYTLGEHGDSQFIPWSNASVGGKRFLDILADNKDRFGEVDLDRFRREIKDRPFEISRIKGTTNYAIAASTVEIIKIILNDENRIIPVSTLLEGEFGEQDVFAGVPAVLNRQGVKEIVEVHLTEEELALFKKSTAIIKEYSQTLFQGAQ